MFVPLAFTGFYMPADGVLAAYERDFGTSRCASRVKDYNSFRRIQNGAQCLLLAQSGHANHTQECPLSGVKRTLIGSAAMSAFDPKRTSKFVFRVNPNRASAPQHWPAFDFLDRNQRWSARACGETYRCCWLGPTACSLSDPPSHPESKAPGEVAALPVGPRLCCLLKQHFDRRGNIAKLLTKDEAKRIAANIAKLPELLRKA
jgi:hypothetical protein